MTVACVNCKTPVSVSAINGVRCNECYILRAEDMNGSLIEPLDMLRAENLRLMKAMEDLENEIQAKLDAAYGDGWADGHAYED